MDTHAPDRRRYEPICGYCGHGKSLHTGPRVLDRTPGWCVGCEARLTEESSEVICRWFEERVAHGFGQ